jgi:hypothetical protein
VPHRRVRWRRCVTQFKGLVQGASTRGAPMCFVGRAHVSVTSYHSKKIENVIID